MKPIRTQPDFVAERRRMVEIIRAYGVDDQRILDAMSRIPREQFIPEPFRDESAYGNHPCPIGHGQTISQPFIVAYMTSMLHLKPGDRVLEVGSGCGYQTAVLAELGGEVYCVELVDELAEYARDTLAEQGYTNVHIRTGDGSFGWVEHAPFDAIIVACAARRIPPALVEQLAEGGRMILPVGHYDQDLVLVTNENKEQKNEYLLKVQFVPLITGGK